MTDAKAAFRAATPRFVLDDGWIDGVPHRRCIDPIHEIVVAVPQEEAAMLMYLFRAAWIGRMSPHRAT